MNTIIKRLTVMKRLQTYSLILLLMISLFASGCVPLLVGTAVGAGGVTYVRGSMKQNVSHPVKDVHKATLSALKKLDIYVISDELNRHNAVINSEFQDGEKVKINIDALTEYVSKISIRIGIFGHQEKSQLILNAIQTQL